MQIAGDNQLSLRFSTIIWSVLAVSYWFMNYSALTFVLACNSYCAQCSLNRSLMDLFIHVLSLDQGHVYKPMTHTPKIISGHMLRSKNSSRRYSLCDSVANLKYPLLRGSSISLGELTRLIQIDLRCGLQFCPCKTDSIRILKTCFTVLLR